MGISTAHKNLFFEPNLKHPNLQKHTHALTCTCTKNTYASIQTHTDIHKTHTNKHTQNTQTNTHTQCRDPYNYVKNVILLRFLLDLSPRYTGCSKKYNFYDRVEYEVNIDLMTSRPLCYEPALKGFFTFLQSDDLSIPASIFHLEVLII